MKKEEVKALVEIAFVVIELALVNSVAYKEGMEKGWQDAKEFYR